MATKKYQIQQLQADESLLTLHPETDASIVKINNSNSTYSNVESAIVGLENKFSALPSSFVTNVKDSKGVAITKDSNGAVTLSKASVGLENVENTSISSAISEVNSSLGGRITALENSVGGLSGAMQFLGKSSTPITDGGAQAPTISGSVVVVANLKNGNVVLYDNQEFVWDGSKWELFGDEGSYALKTTTINNKALSSNITIYTTDIPYGDVSLEDRLEEIEDNVDTAISTANGMGSRIDVVEGEITKIYNGTTTVGKAEEAYTAEEATTATRFKQSVTVELTGDVTGSKSSTSGWSISTTLKNSGVTAGTYSAVTVNAKGIVTAGAKMIEVGGTTPSSSLATGGIFFKEI